MRLLAQVAQVGHTQPRNTRQSSPGDTPRAHQHRLNPDQVGHNCADHDEGDETNSSPVPGFSLRSLWLTALPSLLSYQSPGQPPSLFHQHKIHQKQFDFLYLHMTFGRQSNRIAIREKKPNQNKNYSNFTSLCLKELKAAARQDVLYWAHSFPSMVQRP